MERERFCRDAEQFVLSGMINSENMLCVGVENLKEEDFGALDHQIIFSSLCSLYKEGATPGLEKVIIKLKSQGLLGSINVPEILSKYVPSVEDLLFYINIVSDYSKFRKIEVTNKKIEQELDQEPRRPSDEILAFSRDMLYSINDNQKNCLGVDFKKDCESLDYLTNPKFEKGLMTGMKKLDGILGGMKGGELITIAARPGIGKTTIALNWALSFVKSHCPVSFFSIEMRYSEIKEKIISQVTNIPHKLIQNCLLNANDLEKIKLSLKEIDLGSLMINDKSTMTINELMSKARRMKEICGTKAIFVDYIQLISSDGKSEYRHLEIADMTRKLKCLAKDLDVPIICLAQLSRKVEERTNHTPIMSDLKESGAIEQDSDVVITLSRDDMYDKFLRPGEALLQVLKNRHGPRGDIKLRFEAELSKFVEIE